MIIYLRRNAFNPTFAVIMEYIVNIREMLERTVSVEASSKEEALRKIRKAYFDGDIVLDWDDVKDTEIEVV